MEDEDIKLNPTKKVIKGKLILDKADSKIPYYTLLKMIKNNEIERNGLQFIDDKYRMWKWDTDIKGFIYVNTDNRYDDYLKYLTDEYDELELVDLLVTIVPYQKKENTPKYIATQKVIDIIETMYMDLNMEIDNCQGCMDGLDEAFAELAIYKDIVKFLGGNIENHIQELTNKWFENARKRREETEKEQARKDKVIEKLPLPLLDLINESEPVRNVLWKQNDKINEICDILIENKLKEENL